MKLNVAVHNYSISVRSMEKRYWLRVERVSLGDYVKGKLYHAYDMKIPTKIPGWRRFEGFLTRRFDAHVNMGLVGDPKPSLADRILTWQYRQDVRCHKLNSKGKSILQIEIDRDTWEAIQDAR